ncbi:MAG: hypothetical protein ABI614_06395 [Planctomycetota bacterium]
MVSLVAVEYHHAGCQSAEIVREDVTGYSTPLTADEFTQALLDAGIVPAEELRSLTSSLPPASRDAAPLAWLLIERGKLTAFQAKRLPVPTRGRTTDIAQQPQRTTEANPIKSAEYPAQARFFSERKTTLFTLRMR